MKRAIVSLLMLSLVGCAGSAYEISNRPPAELEKLTDFDLVKAYARMAGGEYGSPTPSLRAEIERRKLFSAEDWDRIDRKKIRIGMPEYAVWCSWGSPDDTRNLVTSDGTRKTLVYSPGGRVYIQNGQVEAMSQ